MQTKDYEKAIITYKEILRKEILRGKRRRSNIEHLANIHLTLVNLLFIKNRIAESDEVLKRLAEINPGCKNASLPIPFPTSKDYKKFGSLLLRAGLKDMAIEQFKKFTDLEPEDPLGYYQLALIYEKQGIHYKAIEQLKKVAKLSTRTMGSSTTLSSFLGDVYFRLALKLEKGESWEEAIKYYRRAIELDNNGIIEAYYSLKWLYEKQGRLEDARGIELKLLKLKPEYEVNYKFSNDTTLLGYSMNEEEFELFNGGKITFFYEASTQRLKSDDKGGRVRNNIYKTDNRYYEVKMVKNLAPNFGFEIDPISKGFPYKWNIDIYHSPVGCHEIICEAKPLGKTQCLLLNNSPANRTNCQTDYIAIDEGSYYLQGGWIRSIEGNAYLGRRWFDSEKCDILYNYAASGIKFPQWRFYSQIVTPPSNAAYCRLWTINYETEGKVYFDDIIFIKLQLPKLAEEGQ